MIESEHFRRAWRLASENMKLEGRRIQIPGIVISSVALCSLGLQTLSPFPLSVLHLLCDRGTLFYLCGLPDFVQSLLYLVFELDFGSIVRVEMQSG